MPRFKIIPSNNSSPSADIIALDAGAVLQVVGRLDCPEADVLRDGHYSFSLRLAEGGMWSIFQRDPSPASSHLLEDQRHQFPHVRSD